MDYKRIDVGAGIGLSLFSITVFLYAGKYKGTGVFQYGPNFFPQFLSACLLVASILMIVQATRGNALKRTETIDKGGFLRAAVSLGITILYLLLMQLLGFFFSTLIFLFVLMTYIGHKNLVMRIISCLAVSLAVFGIFYYFLKIPMPEGILINLLLGRGI